MQAAEEEFAGSPDDGKYIQFNKNRVNFSFGKFKLKFT